MGESGKVLLKIIFGQLINLCAAKVIFKSEERLHAPAKWDESDTQRRTNGAV